MKEHLKKKLYLYLEDNEIYVFVMLRLPDVVTSQ